MTRCQILPGSYCSDSWDSALKKNVVNWLKTEVKEKELTERVQKRALQWEWSRMKQVIIKVSDTALMRPFFT